MAPYSPGTQTDLLCQLIRKATFERAPEHTNRLIANSRAPATGGRVIQPLPQISGAGPVMGIHQQPKGTGQSFVTCRCRLPGFDDQLAGAVFSFTGQATTVGLQQKESANQGFQRIVHGPAYRLAQRYRLPLGR